MLYFYRSGENRISDLKFCIILYYLFYYIIYFQPVIQAQKEWAKSCDDK